MRLSTMLIVIATAALLLAACAPAPAAGSAGNVAVEETANDAMTAEESSDVASTNEASHDDAAMAEEAPAADEMAEEEMVDDAPDDAAATDEQATADEVSDTETETALAADRPAWQQIALTDARTGDAFTLADFAGKTVFVEPFATWCSNCRRQLSNVTQAQTQLGDDVVFIALSVEPNIGDDVLASYAANEGFDLIFAAMPPEMLQELAAIFGQTVSNPPATPHFIVRADGSYTNLVTGLESTEEIVSQIQAEQG